MTLPPPTWHVIEYRGRPGLVRLEDDWRRLYASMPLRTSFHVYEAHLAYVDHLMAAPDRLRCIALSDRQQVRAICLVEAKVDSALGIPVRVWRVTLPSHNPLGDIICPEDDARRALIPALVEHFRRHSEGRQLLVLGPLPEDSVLWSGLAGMASREFYVTRSGSMHVFDCARPFDELMSRTSKRFRQDLRRHLRKLDSLPDVRFDAVSEEPSLAEAFETFLDVEASGWKGETGTHTAIRFRGNQPAFFRALLALRDHGDGCEISSLYAEGRCIATAFNMRTGRDYSGLRMGYDEHYARLRPAQLLLQRTLQRCCEDPGIERFNLTSDSAWQLRWHPDSVALQQGYLGIDRWSGPLLIALLRIRFGYARRFTRWARTQRERLSSETTHHDDSGSRAVHVSRDAPTR